MVRVSDLYKKKDFMSFNKNEFDCPNLINDSKQFYELVFAPDPVTLNPRSDVFYMLSGENPEFQQFIKDKLMAPQPSSPVADSADEALECVQRNLWTNEQYQEFLSDYVRSKMTVLNSDDK